MAYEKANLKFGSIADINNGHYLVMPEVDGIIRSVLNKEASPFYKRIKHKPESHETFRWIEEVSQSRTATMIDPRNITSVPNLGITRVEKLGKLKGMSSAINFGLFDTELTKNGTFAYVLQDDLQNMYTDMMLLENDQMFSGNDTSYSASTTQEYFGVMNAITNTASIPVKTADTATIAASIKSFVAELDARTDVNCTPTAIFMNPLTKDKMDIEELALGDKYKVYTVECVPGLLVTGIMTVVGLLPIITDKRIPIDTSNATVDNHKILIVDESRIVRHHLIGYETPVTFKLGEINTLLTQYVAVQFANVVVEFPDQAHLLITKSFAKSV